jgi:hypothetical protein
VPISIEIEPESGMAIVTCSGVLGINDAKESAAALWKTPGWLGRAAVWDFRAAQFDVSSAGVREIAQFILSHQPAPPPERIAWVTSREVDFGLSRMYGAFREDPRTEFRVFREYEEAVSWARSSRPGVA